MEDVPEQDNQLVVRQWQLLEADAHDEEVEEEEKSRGGTAARIAASTNLAVAHH